MRINRELMGCDVTGGGAYSTTGCDFAKTNGGVNNRARGTFLFYYNFKRRKMEMV